MRSFFWICWLVAQTTDVNGDAVVPVGRVPACGVTATWSLLKCCGRDVALSDIESEFKQIARDTQRQSSLDSGIVSMADVVRVLSSHAANPDALNFKSRSLDDVPTPCILYFRPGAGTKTVRWGRGHFLTFAGFSGEDAIILDWVNWSENPARRIPIAELSREWSGDAVILKRSAHWPTGGTMVLLTVTALVISLRRRAGARILACAAAGLFMGCQPSSEVQPRETATLVFENPVSLKGTVGLGTPITHDFPFRVWHHSDVTITHIHSSCGCTTGSVDFIGKKLEAGREYSFPVRVRPEAEDFSRTQSLRLETEPASPFPLALAIQYRVEAGPAPRRKQVVVRCLPGDIADVEISFADRRRKESPQVKLKPDAFRSNEFNLTSFESSTETSRVSLNTEEVLAHDLLTIKLRSKSRLSAGIHRGSAEFFFTDGSRHVIQTEIHVTPPFETVLKQVFCGYLKPGQPFGLKVPCRRGQLDADAKIDVRSDTPSISGEYTGNVIQVSGTAPANAGRFSAELTISEASNTFVPIVLPVSGIVQP